MGGPGTCPQVYWGTLVYTVIVRRFKRSIYKNKHFFKHMLAISSYEWAWISNTLSSLTTRRRSDGIYLPTLACNCIVMSSSPEWCNINYPHCSHQEGFPGLESVHHAPENWNAKSGPAHPWDGVRQLFQAEAAVKCWDALHPRPAWPLPCLLAWQVSKRRVGWLTPSSSATGKNHGNRSEEEVGATAVLPPPHSLEGEHAGRVSTFLSSSTAHTSSNRLTVLEFSAPSQFWRSTKQQRG